MVRIFAFVFVLLLVSGCKIGQSSTGSTVVRRSANYQMLKPDACKINAKVLRMEEPGVYTLRVYQVVEMGFGFKQNLNDGDKIEIHSPVDLPVESTIDVLVTYVREQEGGYYMLSTSAE